MHDKTSRWLDGDLPHELQRVLASAADDGGDAGQIARLQAKLEAQLGQTLSRAGQLSEHAGAPVGIRAGERTLVAAKGLGLPGAVAAGALAALLGLGALYLGTHTRDQALAPEPQPHRPASEHAASARSEATPAVPAPIRNEPAPPAPQAKTTLQEPLKAKPVSPQAASAPPRRGLGEELRQLEAIRRQLARNPARALAAADRHARSFPEGTLGPERDLLRVEALLLLDQRDRARALADRIIRTPGGSPYAAQLRQLLSMH